MASFNLHAMGAETSSGIGSMVNTDNLLIGLFLNISAVSGTLPTLVIKLQHSPNGTDWYDVSGTTTGSLASTGLTSITPSSTQYVADSVRIVWTIGGLSPSFTFSVDIETA